tara:strand:+ start:760 stop:1137 length:378 start_codon:yes stop_codon:yes gene_type:complete
MSQQDNSISLQTAQDWTTEWRSVESTYNKHNECNGFLIPAEDLQAVLDEMEDQKGTKKVRAYLGVDPTTNEEKLIFVATQPDDQHDGSIIYRDMINGYNGLQTGGKLYDFTYPDPPASDPLSPLN